MPLSAPKLFAQSRLTSEPQTGLTRDLTWDRPVFRPPLLQNLRVIFDPLPFTTQRLSATPRQTARR